MEYINSIIWKYKSYISNQINKGNDITLSKLYKVKQKLNLILYFIILFLHDSFSLHFADIAISSESFIYNF